MLSEGRHSSRSSTESVHTDSVRTGPTNRLATRQSQRSSITEEDDDNNNVPKAPPIPSSFGVSAKSSSSSATSTPTRVTPKQTTRGGINPAKIINAIAFQRPPVRNDGSGQKNNSTQRNLNQSTIPSESKRTLQGLFGRVSARDIENEKPTPISVSQSRQGNPNQSIFEKVDKHGGHATYLGSGSFLQLEDCIRNCLSHDKCHTDFTNYNNTKHDYSYKSLTRASILEDYSYDGILTPNYHVTIPIDTHHHHHHSSNHKKHAAELSLEEIRQVNDSLAKYGIPVFSSQANHYNKPRAVGDVLSVCQQLLADSAHRSHGDEAHAVQHVWDNLHYHSPQTNIYGYASPAVQGVASHLFHPGQPPYSPVQSAVSHLFSNPQATSYNPGQGAPPPSYGYPPQNSNNPGQSAISRLFGNPGQGAPPPSYGPPPQSSNNAGQSVLSRLFSGQPQ